MGVSIREVALKKGGISFSIDIYFEGKRKQEKTKIRSDKPAGRKYQEARRLVETVAAGYEAQLKIDPEAVFLGKERRSTDFLEYFEKEMHFDRHGQPVKKKPASPFSSSLKHLRDFNRGKPLLMGSISQALAEQFRAYLDSLPLAKTSKENYLNGLKVILRRAVGKNLIPAFAGKLKPFGKGDVPLKYLTIDQIKAIEVTPCKNPAVRIAFLFACFTGLRISDLQALRDGDIQHNGERLEIHYRMQKTQKHQVLVLGAQAVRYLQEARALHEYRPAGNDKVFALPSVSHCINVLKVWGNAAGIPFGITTHCARHSFAVLSLQSGVDLYTLSKLMGHADIATTQIYAKMVDSMKTAAMDKLPNW